MEMPFTLKFWQVIIRDPFLGSPMSSLLGHQVLLLVGAPLSLGDNHINWSLVPGGYDLESILSLRNEVTLLGEVSGDSGKPQAGRGGSSWFFPVTSCRGGDHASWWGIRTGPYDSSPHQSPEMVQTKGHQCHPAIDKFHNFFSVPFDLTSRYHLKLSTIWNLNLLPYTRLHLSPFASNLGPSWAGCLPSTCQV